MLIKLKVGTKVEAIAAVMSSKGQTHLPLIEIHKMLHSVGFGDTSPEGTRTCVARDFKQKKWSKAKYTDDIVKYRLTSKFFIELQDSVDRFVELFPSGEKEIRESFKGYIGARLPEPKKDEPEKDEPEKQAIEIPKKKSFGGKQPPGLHINGCNCSYSTLIKAIACAQTEPFTRAEMVRYANEVQIGLNQYSIGNGWYQVRKRKMLREVKGKGNQYEVTNDLFIENKKFFPDFYKILPNHIEIIAANYQKAIQGDFRSAIDPIEPEIEETTTTEPEETGTLIEAQAIDHVKPDFEQTIENPPIEQESNIQEIRELALSLGLIDEKPAIDPKVFIGECIVSYLEATAKPDAFKSPSIGLSPGQVQQVPAKETPASKPANKDEYARRFMELNGHLQTMKTAKEKAENLAKKLESANFELKQQKAKVESELNKLRFQGDKTLLPGQTDRKVKLGSVVRFKS